LVPTTTPQTLHSVPSLFPQVSPGDEEQEKNEEREIKQEKEKRKETKVKPRTRLFGTLMHLVVGMCPAWALGVSDQSMARGVGCNAQNTALGVDLYDMTAPSRLLKAIVVPTGLKVLAASRPQRKDVFLGAWWYLGCTAPLSGPSLHHLAPQVRASSANWRNYRNGKHGLVC
jgi:hypothetical protein